MAGKLFYAGIVITGDGKGGIRTLKVTGDELNKVRKEIGKTNAAARTMSTGMGGMFKQMTSVRGILRELGPMFGTISGGLMVKSIIDAGLAMDGYGRALRAVMGSAEAASRELEFVRTEAQRVGVEFAPLVREYAKLAAAARQTSLEGQGVRDTFTAIIEISRVLNLSAEDTRGSIFALQQMLSKGKVSSEELRRQLGERIPGAMNAMARATGKTVEELDKLLKLGALNSEEVMPKFSAELRRMAEAGLEFARFSPQAEFARLKNSIFQLNVEAAKNTLPLLADGAKAAVVALDALVPRVEMIGRLLLTFAGVKAGQSLMARAFGGTKPIFKQFNQDVEMFGKRMAFMNARITATSMVVGKLKGAVSALGGPLGILLMAATAWSVYRSQQEAARRETENMIEQLRTQYDELELLNELTLRSVMSNAQETMFDIDEERRGIQELLEAKRELLESGAPLIQEDPQEGLESQMERQEAAAEALKAEIAGLESELNRLNLTYAEMEKVNVEASVQLSQMGGDADVAADAARKLGDEARSLTGALNAKAKTLDTTRDALLQQADQLLANATGEEEWYETLRQAAKYLEERIRQVKEAAAAEKLLNKQVSEGTKTWQDYLKATDPVAAAWADYGKKAADMAVAMIKQGRSAEEVADAVEWLKNQYGELASAQYLAQQSSEDIVESFREEIENLEEENELMAQAIELNISLAAAKALANGATIEEIQYYEELKAKHKQLQDAMSDSTEAAETWQTALKRGVERLDDAFADFWETILSGGKNAFDALKNLAIQTVAEIIHALTTRRLTAAITSAFMPQMSMAGGANIAAAGGGAGNWANTAMSAFGLQQGGFFAGTSGLSGFGALFSGNGIGMGFQSLPTWMGGSMTSGPLGNIAGLPGSEAAGGLFGNAGAYANWQYGLAGILGGIGGQLLFGGQGGIGGSLGATIGMAVGGPVGALVGGLLGGFVGGLFKDRKPKLTGAGSNVGPGRGYDYGDLTNKGLNESALGGFYLGDGQGGVGEFRNEAVASLQEFDSLVASILTDTQLEAATAGLSDWVVTLKEDALSLENLIESRWSVILGTLEADIQAWVRGATGIEEQLDRLNLANSAQKIIEELPDMFAGRTWQEFIVLAEAMQNEGEALNDTFARLVQEIQVVGEALGALSKYMDGDLAEEYGDLVLGQMMTLTDAGEKAAEALREALDNYDQSTQSLVELSMLAASRYDLELKMLAEVDQAWISITQSMNGMIESIQEDLRAPDENYNAYKKRADDLAASLIGMTDPAQIQATIQEIERLTGKAYGFLTDEQKALMGPEFIQFLEDVRDIGYGNLGERRDEILSDSEQLRDDVRETVGEIRDPLLFVADQLGISADELIAAGIALTAAADYIGDGGGDGVIDPGDRRIGKPIGYDEINVAVEPVEVDVKLDASNVDSVVINSINSNTRNTNAIISSINGLISVLRKTYGKEVGGNLR